MFPYKLDMIYLYFNQEEKRLYLFKKPDDMTSSWPEKTCACFWEDIESVTADKERGQICAHSLKKLGIVAEFPIGRTIPTCQQPLKK